MSAPRNLPAVADYHVDRTGPVIRVSGALKIANAAAIWGELRSVSRADDPELDIDLSRVTALDGAIASLLVEIRAELLQRGARCEIVGAPDQVEALVNIYRGHDALTPAIPVVKKRAVVAMVEQIGDGSFGALRNVKTTVTFVGDLVDAVVGIIRKPITSNLKDVAPLAARAGTDGIAIVFVLNFLVGFVIAFQFARALSSYGANRYVADVVGLSVTRELAPLMTAVIMSGRSGASFAAEIGTMKVSEELDALRTMGLAPERYLLLPRVAALMLVAPVLTLLADVAAVLGGATVGAASLGVSLREYAAEISTSLHVWDVGSGLLKSVAFGGAIALIGCRQGFNTRGGADGVGRSTTATVVSCLFVIVLLDTAFTVLFQVWGK